MTPTLHHVQRASLVLLVFSLLAAGILAGTYLITAPRIQQAENEARLDLVKQILPDDLFDNDLLATERTLRAADAPTLNNVEDTPYYLATVQGKPTAIILQANAPDGYAGTITLLIGVLSDGTVSGVRALHHKETPGLGDYIQLGKPYTSQGQRKTDWVRQLDRQPPQAAPQWAVSKDGGHFDYMAGATISPRAVLKAVATTQQFVLTHRDRLFNP
ncbi:RnfABCDGE type electron transport complex subunit G [Chitinivorax sp. B]|uniref:RnfABCDGE type electron transport complex subunit G n=1 Tax=Chitinivorax sp. B TaxID=2502235 RepID=UPI0010F4EFF0|nr:RnfABCDGE type electron transport complex subunit G [Chitinivorax sp. B]